MLDAVLSLQPRLARGRGQPWIGGSPGVHTSAGAAAGDRGNNVAGVTSEPWGQQQQPTMADEEVLAAKINEMRTALPAPLRRDAASALHSPFAPLPNGGVNSLGVVLGHEIERWARGVHAAVFSTVAFNRKISLC